MKTNRKREYSLRIPITFSIPSIFHNSTDKWVEDRWIKIYENGELVLTITKENYRENSTFQKLFFNKSKISFVSGFRNTKDSELIYKIGTEFLRFKNEKNGTTIQYPLEIKGSNNRITIPNVFSELRIIQKYNL